MRKDVLFSRKSDEWTTPQGLFDALHAEFYFTLDGAARARNAKLPNYLTNALRAPVGRETIFLNPPYSKCLEFVHWSASCAAIGSTVVCLVPARTDTRWWHRYIWDEKRHRFRPGVKVRFLKGRLKFGTERNSAPFPSAVVVFRPTKSRRLASKSA